MRTSYAAFLQELRRRREELSRLPFVRVEDVELLDAAKCKTVGDLLRDVGDPGPALAAIAILRQMLGHDTVVDALPEEGGTRLVVGSLRVDGDLVNAGVLAVTGDVTVGGSYAETSASAQLLVGGTLEVEHLIAEGAVQVLGGLRARGLVLVRGKSGDLVVGGELSARAFVEDHKTVRFGALRCGRHLKGTQDLASILAPEVFTAGGTLDLPLLVERLRGGLPTLLATIPPGASTLSPRLADLVEFARKATQWHFEIAHGRPCLVLQLPDGSKQRSFLSPEERGKLEVALNAM